MIALYGHRGRSDCGDHDHLGLVAALRAHDAALAAGLMAEHPFATEVDLNLDRPSRALHP